MSLRWRKKVLQVVCVCVGKKKKVKHGCWELSPDRTPIPQSCVIKGCLMKLFYDLKVYKDKAIKQISDWNQDF